MRKLIILICLLLSSVCFCEKYVIMKKEDYQTLKHLRIQLVSMRCAKSYGRIDEVVNKLSDTLDEVKHIEIGSGGYDTLLKAFKPLSNQLTIEDELSLIKGRLDSIDMRLLHLKRIK